MNYNKVSEAVKALANDLLSNKDIANRVIFKKKNVFYVYGLFEIRDTHGSWVVTSEFNPRPVKFYSSKTALAWCILTKAGNSSEAREIFRLDAALAFKQSNIEHYIEQLKKEPNDTFIIIKARLSEDIARRNVLKKQLSKSIEMAKYIQIKGTS